MRRRGIAGLAVSSLLGALLVLFTPDAVSANDVITVTTTEDVVDAGDGVLSLREAVAQASATAGADVVQLAQSAVYHLTHECDTTMDYPPEQPLGHSSGDDLTVEGAGATITQDAQPVPYCNTRVFDVGTGRLTLHDVSITGGTAWGWCFDLGPGTCEPGDQGRGGAVRSNGPVVLDHATLTGHYASYAGGAVYSSSSIDVIDSTISGNEAATGGALHAAGRLTVSRSTLESNRTHGYTFVDFNGCAGGLGGAATATTIIVTDSLIADNVAEAAHPVYCGYYGGRGGGLWAPDVSVTNSTVVRNRAESASEAAPDGADRGQGGAIIAYRAVLSHATVVANEGPMGSVSASETLTSTRSIVSAPTGSTACTSGGSRISGGYNVVGDDTCGLDTGTGDQASVTSLGLGPLADNGGPTRTRLPTDDGPLSIIPLAVCGSDPDQRGLPRPQGAACEVGAVEVGFDPEAVYPDVPASGAPAVDWAARHALIEGQPDGTFGSKLVMTRGEAVALLWRMMGAPVAHARVPFTDVPRDSPYRRAVKWALEHHLVGATPHGTFRPGAAMVRGPYVRMLWQAAGSPGGSPHHPFTDVPGHPGYEPAIDWVAAQGLVATTPPTFRPAGPVRRLAAVKLLHLAATTATVWSEVDPPPTAEL